MRVKLTLREVERDVVVVRGKYKFKPRVEGHDAIDLYGDTADDGSGGAGTGDFATFLVWAGRFIEPAQPFLNEVKVFPNEEVTWLYHARAASNSKLVLKHLEEQTGLTFTPERRKVRILFVEAAK